MLTQNSLSLILKIFDQSNLSKNIVLVNYRTLYCLLHCLYVCFNSKEFYYNNVHNNFHDTTILIILQVFRFLKGVVHF